MAEQIPGTVVRRSATIGWYDRQVPDVRPPDYAGRRYRATVPDTIDLQDMAARAANGLTGPTDPDTDYEIYWRAAFNTNPPVMWHSESDCVQCKFMEALPLMRTISGDGCGAEVEQRWMEVMLQAQGPDGLVYLPKAGRPWCVFRTYGKEPPGDHYFSPWFEGRILGAYAIYHLLTGDDRFKRAAERLVDGLGGLLVHDGSKARFPNHEFGTGGRYVAPDKPSDAVHSIATYHGWAVQGLANAARTLGCERALEHAGSIARWIREDAGDFDDEGRYLPEYPDVEHIHFHGHTEVLLSVLDYGLAAGDAEAVDFAHRGFVYGMGQGECLLGYFPEWLGVARPQTLEVCELAEMLALAVKLSAAGVGDYWDMADRWTRNLFFESQLHDRHVPFLEWRSLRTPTTETARTVLPPYHETDGAIRRNVGGFGGWLAPNDWLPDYPHHCQYRDPGVMHCCTGNGTRAIHYLWEHALRCEADHLRVHLLMNRVSEWADVHSHVPYEGRVDVDVKRPVSVSIRLPEWVQGEEVTCAVDDQPRRFEVEGRYVLIGQVAAGATATLRFPIPQRDELIDVEKRTYRILLRGSTCVAIDPPGLNVPLFRRDHYLAGCTRWRTAERFVADRTVRW